MSSVTVRFRPLRRETLQLLVDVYAASGNDPTEAYNRLVSAAAVAGAMLDHDPENASELFEQAVKAAMRAIVLHPDIFGDETGKPIFHA